VDNPFGRAFVRFCGATNGIGWSHLFEARRPTGRRNALSDQMHHAGLDHGLGKKTALIASGKPFRLSTRAIRISVTPWFKAHLRKAKARTIDALW
jgi:hypothetical protein